MGELMRHPLVKLAKGNFYLNSHSKVPLITKKPLITDSDEFLIKANELVRDLDNYPHAFLLACLMDTGTDANIAWSIPYRIMKEIGDFKIKALYNISLNNLTKMFNSDPKWHRYPNARANFFFAGVKKIVEDESFSGDAAKLWSGKPASTAVVTKFLEFKGCGFKVANMAPNLLYRYFGVEFANYSGIDIAPDVHTMRVFTRLGLIPKVNDPDIRRIYTICKARELNPKFPGLVDGLCWEIGRDYCKARKPNCTICPLMKICKKLT